MTGYLKTLDGREHPVEHPEQAIECFRCGVCCTRYQPRVDMVEIYALADGLRLSRDEVMSRYIQVTTVGYLIRHGKKGCVFLRWEKNGTRATCRVHAFRPESCRAWTPGLSRRECRQGLAALQPVDRILTASELYPAAENWNKFSGLRR
jgi:Fe-S-cluster containining protein